MAVGTVDGRLGIRDLLPMDKGQAIYTPFAAVLLQLLTLFSSGRSSMHFKQKECRQGRVLGSAYCCEHTLQVISEDCSAITVCLRIRK